MIAEQRCHIVSLSSQLAEAELQHEFVKAELKAIQEKLMTMNKRDEDNYLPKQRETVVDVGHEIVAMTTCAPTPDVHSDVVNVGDGVFCNAQVTDATAAIQADTADAESGLSIPAQSSDYEFIVIKQLRSQLNDLNEAYATRGRLIDRLQATAQMEHAAMVRADLVSCRAWCLMTSRLFCNY